MERIHSINPFSKRESHTNANLTVLKIASIISWFLVLVPSIHFAWNAPHGYYNRSIWGQSQAHVTPFTLNAEITDVYWVLMLIFQLVYVYNLFTGPHVKNSANIAPHFIFNNLAIFAFIMLWVYWHPVIAEIVLIINFFNLSSLYFRHSTYALVIHWPVVSAPLAFNFVALFWVGAAAVRASAHSLIANIFAYLAIWGILGYGLFFCIAFKDWTVGFNLSILTFALAIKQLSVHVLDLQWIFAFAIAGTLLLMSFLVAMPGLFGSPRFGKPGTVVSEDREREPLLTA